MLEYQEGFVNIDGRTIHIKHTKARGGGIRANSVADRTISSTIATGLSTSLPVTLSRNTNI